jgi:hypothetical protein
MATAILRPFPPVWPFLRSHGTLAHSSTLTESGTFRRQLRRAIGQGTAGRRTPGDTQKIPDLARARVHASQAVPHPPGRVGFCDGRSAPPERVAGWLEGLEGRFAVLGRKL